MSSDYILVVALATLTLVLNKGLKQTCPRYLRTRTQHRYTPIHYSMRFNVIHELWFAFVELLYNTTIIPFSLAQEK